MVWPNNYYTIEMFGSVDVLKAPLTQTMQKLGKIRSNFKYSIEKKISMTTEQKI